jgi:dimethylamine/trimethylamine dehydrogenase
VQNGSVTLESLHTGRRWELEAASTVMATSREPQDSLYHALSGRIAIDRVGDCLAPGTIATAVYSGHRYARELDAEAAGDVMFRRE